MEREREPCSSTALGTQPVPSCAGREGEYNSRDPLAMQETRPETSIQLPQMC